MNQIEGKKFMAYFRTGFYTIMYTLNSHVGPDGSRWRTTTISIDAAFVRKMKRLPSALLVHSFFVHSLLLN